MERFNVKCSYGKVTNYQCRLRKTPDERLRHAKKPYLFFLTQVALLVA